MGIPLLSFFFLFMRLLAEISGGSQHDEYCKAARCSPPAGPVIRFPFWLKHRQPDHCGYPGFELSCSEKNQTLLELPSYSAKLWVKKINYTSQEMIVRHLDDYCLQRQHHILNLSASPFHFSYDYSISIDDFSFFNCSENKASDQLIISIPCSFLSSNYNPVYATPSYVYLTDVNLTSCRKIFNATLQEFILDGEYEFSMNWSNPICGNCEAQGNKCQRKMKSNSTEPEIECIQKPAKGTN